LLVFFEEEKGVNSVETAVTLIVITAPFALKFVTVAPATVEVLAADESAVVTKLFLALSHVEPLNNIRSAPSWVIVGLA
jgi:hypothetical protein